MMVWFEGGMREGGMRHDDGLREVCVMMLV